MRYTAKWWRDHAEKPVGTEYWSGVSLNEVESRVRDCICLSFLLRILNKRST